MFVEPDGSRLGGVQRLRPVLSWSTAALIGSVLVGLFVGLGLTFLLGPGRSCNFSPCATTATGQPCLESLVQGSCTITAGVIALAVAAAVAAALATGEITSRWQKRRGQRTQES